VVSNFSTAFHPQTEGQTERVNQQVEPYLRIFCNDEQDNWADFLDLAEFQYNNQKRTSAGYSPFEANHGHHPIHSAVILPSPNPSIQQTLERMQIVREFLVANLENAEKTYAEYYNRKTKEPPTHQVGDRV
jgi:hypothetical protein